LYAAISQQFGFDCQKSSESAISAQLIENDGIRCIDGSKSQYCGQNINLLHASLNSISISLSHFA